jgi:siroheme synthase (precorrin-2 oxidase/ferrochelatase)
MTLQERIDELVQQHGSLRAVARVTEIDAGYLSRLRAGEKVNPEKDKLRRLGLRRVVSYERIKTPNANSTADPAA